MQSTIESLAGLQRELDQRIRGQTEALSRLLGALARRELDTVPQRGPRGCFFFAGPTGVGKTETARIMGEILCQGSELLRIDCSEYKTLASFAALLGDRMADRGRLGRAYDLRDKAFETLGCIKRLLNLRRDPWPSSAEPCFGQFLGASTVLPLCQPLFWGRESQPIIHRADVFTVGGVDK